MRRFVFTACLMLSVLLLAPLGLAVLPADAQTLESIVVYSGRSEELIGPLMERFTEETGVEVQVRYGGTAELAVAILEEGANSPADVFIAQDAGALGALAAEGRLALLPGDIRERVAPRFQSEAGLWVGVSGRARTVVYNTDLVSADELPDSIWGFTDPAWARRIGWAPTNGSFQAFVTAVRLIEGEARAREWLEGIAANGAQAYANNTQIVAAVATGEIAAGFVNHYYLYRTLAEDPGQPVQNYFLSDGDVGALVNVAGAGIVDTSARKGLAQRLILYLLSEGAQQYFAQSTYEYPLVAGVPAFEGLPPLAEIETPDIDLTALADLEGTLSLLSDVGVLP
ncbi:MAG: iron ABC transporter substrate-binding protein [Anaerolineae bacterium]|nr:iron ABC transporter substrate-binding protein [Anaerolineae bacterium]